MIKRDRIPDILIERYILGEVSADERRRITVRMKRDSAFRQRVDDLKKSNSNVLKQYPTAQMTDRIRSRKTVSLPRMRPTLHIRTMILPLAAAALLLFIAVPVSMKYILQTNQTASDTVSANRIKGAPELVLYVKRVNGVMPLIQDERLAAGTVVQIGYNAGSARYGMIFSVDGRGMLTPHLSGNHGAALTQGKTAFLKESYTLDDAPEHETFYFITSREPIDDQSVMRSAALMAKGGGAVFKGYAVHTVRIHKTESAGHR